MFLKIYHQFFCCFPALP